MTRRNRPGYTLLEVILTLAIASLVVAAVYSVIGYQLRQTQAGRDLVEQTTLARAILNRMQADVLATVGLNNAARYRNQDDAGTAALPSDSSSTTGTSGGSSSTGGTGTAGGTGSTTSGTSGTSSSTETTTPSTGSTTSTSQSVIQLPLGVIGGPNVLHLFVSKVPGEVHGSLASGGVPQLTCDLRRVSYWLGDDAIGLCRMEVRLITSEQGLNTELPGGDLQQYLLASEVKSLELSYFDGSAWQDLWDSTETGADGVTPRGSPRAIKMRVGLAMPGRTVEGTEPEIKYHTHIVFIPTAGGVPPATVSTTAEGATTAP